jgi:hypothetical protein
MVLITEDLRRLEALGQKGREEYLAGIRSFLEARSR